MMKTVQSAIPRPTIDGPLSSAGPARDHIHVTAGGSADGILVVNKPPRLTSAQVVSRVKTALKARKVGHTGTLDPFATGVLVCCINRATKLARFLMHGMKRYEGAMCLGVRTDTQDLTGRVISQSSHLKVAAAEIHAAFCRMRGVCEQRPPAFSALKHHGVPLYKLAREGAMIAKPARPIEVHELEVVGIALPLVRFRVACSQGTYVRTLCADIGDALGCGAHLVELCRTESGGFSLDEAVSLEALQEAAVSEAAARWLVPMASALRRIPEIRVDQALAGKIEQGHPISGEQLGAHGNSSSLWIKVTDGRGNLLALLDSRKRNGIFPYACVFPGNL